jgi:hypothetical protein
MSKSTHPKRNAGDDAEGSVPRSDAARIPASAALDPAFIWPLDEIGLIDSLIRDGDDVLSETDERIPGTDIVIQEIGGDDTPEPDIEIQVLGGEDTPEPDIEFYELGGKRLSR